MEKEEINTRTECTDCVRDNRRRIFGWSFLVIGALVLAYLFLTGGAAAILCLAGGGFLGLLAEICLFCGSECSNICGT